MRCTVRIALILLGCIAAMGSEASAQATQSAVPPAKPLPPPAYITVQELKAKIAKNEPLAIIDVRGSAAFSESSQKVKGAIHIKMRRVKARLKRAPLKDVPRDRIIVTYCSCPNDEVAIMAAQVLKDNGFTNARVLQGGWTAWIKAGGQTEKRQKV